MSLLQQMLPYMTATEAASTYYVSPAEAQEDAASLQYQTAEHQLAEQEREFNVQQQAQQTSAQQAAGGITNLVNEYNQAYSQAVASYTQTYNQMLGTIGDVGGQQAADIRSQYGAQASSGLQNLARLGLSNTTIGSNQQLGIQRQQSAALNTLANQINAQELGVMENKKTNQELAPSTAALQTAIQQGQQASGGYGGQLTQALGALQF